MTASADATVFIPAPRQTVSGRYELVSELGRGGMGTVWRARNLALDAPCAVKFMLPELAQKEDLRARFMREARAAAQLHSPHIVTVFDVGDWHGVPFMAMEFLEGESLEVLLEREGKLSFAQTLEVIIQVATGLETAHARGLVHRDLKPANIFLLSGERTAVKILDFGVAKQAGTTSGVKTLHGALLGTPHYMAPEQARGDASLDRRADVWSLGVVAYQCLTGNLPFDGDSLPALLGAILAGEIPSTGNPILDPFWERASQRDVNLRYQSARELANGLRLTLAGSVPRLPAPVPTPPPPPATAVGPVEPAEAAPALPMRRDMRLSIAIGVIAALLVGFALAMVSRDRDAATQEGAANEPASPAPPSSITPAPEPAPAPAPETAPQPQPSPPPGQPAAATEQPASGVAIESRPSGATVFVDGKRAARRTPAKVTDLAPGLHAIRLEKEGFQPWEQSIVLAAGSVLELPPAVLQAAAVPPKQGAIGAAPAPSRTQEPARPRAPAARAPTAPAQSERSAPRPDRPRLGKYDDLIGF